MSTFYDPAVEDAKKAQFVGKVERPVSVYEIECILEGAFEGGSNYWVTKITSASPEIDKDAYTYYSELVAVHDGKVTIEAQDDWGDADEYTRTIGRDDIVRGINLWAAIKPSYNLDEADAIDCDNILQLAMWGEIVFG